MKRYDVELGDPVADAEPGPWPMVERDDGDWVDAEEASVIEYEADELRCRLRSITQTLAEELGAERPISAEGAASMAVDAIREARTTARELEEENRELHYRFFNIARQIPDWPIDE